MERKRILHAEDDVAAAELTVAALASLGLAGDVVTVGDGETVLDQLGLRGDSKSTRPEPPRFLLLDLKLPGMSGLEVLAEIRRQPSLRTLPVVILSSSSDPAQLRQCYELRANAYVIKPATSRKFADAIGSLGAFCAGVNETPPQLAEAVI
jgi:CheY-like chemotaxis protein